MGARKKRLHSPSLCLTLGICNFHLKSLVVTFAENHKFLTPWKKQDFVLKNRLRKIFKKYIKKVIWMGGLASLAERIGFTIFSFVCRQREKDKERERVIERERKK